MPKVVIALVAGYAIAAGAEKRHQADQPPGTTAPPGGLYPGAAQSRPGGAIHWIAIESEGPLAGGGGSLPDRVRPARRFDPGRVVGFRDHHVLLDAAGRGQTASSGSEVIALGSALRVPVGEHLKGRVIDGLWPPLDWRPRAWKGTDFDQSEPVQPPHPLQAQADSDALPNRHQGDRHFYPAAGTRPAPWNFRRQRCGEIHPAWA